jgi:hypothetical protein
MRRLALALVVAVLLPAATVAGSAARSSTTAAACSKAAASKAMTRYGIGVIKPYQPKAPVYQVLCGPFLGPGSQHKDGAFTSCDGSGCLQNWDDRARVVAWGEANEWNAFHCIVEQGRYVHGDRRQGSGARFSDQRVRRHARVVVVAGSFPAAPSLRRQRPRSGRAKH